MTTGFGFCANCGTPRTAVDQKFCNTCGSAFPAATPPSPPAQPIPVAPPPPPATAAAWSMPPAPPSAPFYAGSPSGPVAPPPRAGRGGCLKPLGCLGSILGILLVVFLVIPLVTVSYLGVVQVPVLSAALGMDRPRDLHMVKDNAALGAFLGKWGITMPSPIQNYTLGNKHHYSGTVHVDDTISEGALAALPEYSAANNIISQIQFRIHEGSIELSAFVNVPGYPASGPVYAEFSISANSSRTVELSFSHLDFGRVGVPNSIVDTVRTSLSGSLNNKIAQTGVTIDALELHEGAIRFKGTWPKTITAD